MNFDDVAVATITKVRGKHDGGLIVEALTDLASKGMPLSVSDGGSSRHFLDRVGRLPNVSLVPPSADGLVAQVRASVKSAQRTGRRFILYTEPDKRLFVTRWMPDFLTRAADDDDVGIVLAARSTAGFRTFPAFQRYTETAANELCYAATGLRNDYFYGPFLMARRLATQVGRAPHTLGWGWRPFLFVTAHRLGLRIVSVTGHYRCPTDQRYENDRDKQHRVRQLAENALGVVAASAHWTAD